MGPAHCRLEEDRQYRARKAAAHNETSAHQAQDQLQDRGHPRMHRLEEMIDFY
jgi:hypothetical protein